ncbi:MAG: Calx-beta domain-containing protein, partial [Myxococcota bacterium]
VLRTGGALGAVGVAYSTRRLGDGTSPYAQDSDIAAPADYDGTYASLAFADGELQKSFTVTLYGDAVHEGDETFEVYLLEPSGGTSLGSAEAVRATVTIVDDDEAPTASCDGVTCSGHGTCVLTGTPTVASCTCNVDYHPVGLTCVADTSTAAPFWYEDFRDGTLNNSLGTEPGTFHLGGNGYGDTPTVSTELSLTGGHSVKLAYAPGVANAGWPELRFNLATAVEHLWVRYWLHVPGNIEHGGQSPNNNKFFIIDNEPSTGASTAYYDFEHYSDYLKHQVSFGGTSHGWTWPSKNKIPPAAGNNIDLHAFAGQWIELLFEIKRESYAGAQDPIVRIWVDGTKHWNLSGPGVCPEPLTGTGDDWCNNYQSTGINGFVEGYFMGWANAAWSAAEPAVFYIDRVEWFDANPDSSTYQ